MSDRLMQSPYEEPQDASVTPPGGQMIPPRFSLKQRAHVALSPDNQLGKSRYTAPYQLNVPASERTGFSCDLVDTQEVIAIVFNPDEREVRDAAAFERRETLKVKALEGTASKLGQPASKMHSEISGAAGDATLIGAGNIAGNVIKYGNNLLI